ncbi:MAG: preprotein translocase subunit SecA [Phycisphaeraceae bacterium]|nr:preprotein translocase subunit SecA [Phycisphaeraceae bacterium]
MSGKQDIPLIGPILNRIIGTRNDRFVKRYTTRTEQITALEPEMRKLDDEALRVKVKGFRDRFDKGEKLDDLQIEAFAVAREVMDRSVGIRKLFSPEHKFDPSVMPADVRAVYDKTKAEMDAKEPSQPTGDLMGNKGEIAAWVTTPIPLAIYEWARTWQEESRPPFRSRPFDVQLIGGMVLSQGKIAEMKTGEGKTIVAPLACYLACVGRQRVHVVTVNDYLVQRDRDWVFPYFYWLGLTVGAIHPQHMQGEDEKRRMYVCDVVYGTTAEFGFDYLRDNMKRQAEAQVQRARQFAIVDEVDSVLIDEARTPLIISGAAHEDSPRYDMANKLAKHLVDKQKPWTEAEDRVTACKERIKGLEGDVRQVRDKARVPEIQAKLEAARKELPELEADRDRHTQFFEVKMERKSCHLTHDGVAEAQRVAGIGSFYVDQNMDLPHLLEQSLRAHAVYQLDKDYVVMPTPNPQTGRTEPSIVIVDTFTGRPMIGRQWSDGLHQAIETKEGVPIRQETQTVATITIQNFFKMYKRLAGMTGTADTEAQEFHDIYGLDVVSIPTNKEVVRVDHADMMFLRARDKWESIVDEIKAFHDVGRPILVGTTSVERSEKVSEMLSKKYQIKHEVLNAKQHEREAGMVEGAGQLGAVMIATNMAGRGTDIKLGKCTRQALLDHWLRREICGKGLTPESSEEQLRENVYRKVGPRELGIRKDEAASMDLSELEMRLLRHWAVKHTFVAEKSIDAMSADELRQVLDASGRSLLHRITWFGTVEQMGGLHVIGTERHESRRIDNQLRGRSGRQGDKGSSRFYVSLEDELMQLFGGEAMMKILPRLGMKEGDAIESKMLSGRIEAAQRKVEERNFQIRKNILEYDEVMEHQRQHFYGLRQRSLEGRDVKGLIFEFVGDSIDDAVDEYLDPEYPAVCAAEFAKEKLDCSILPERLRRREEGELTTAIKRMAKEDARHNIDITLGEYIPMEGSEIAVEFDSAGLVAWAKSRFGVEINAADLREGGAEERRHVYELLCNAAEEKIEAADLSGIATYLDKSYGAVQLSEWAKRKFGFEVKPEDLLAAAEAVKDRREDAKTPAELIMDRVRELWDRREVEYPVDFAVEMTQATMIQGGPAAAFKQLGEWARRRYGLEWTEDEIKKIPPKQIREKLLVESKKAVEDDRLEQEIQAALKCRKDDDLDAHLKERFGQGIFDRMRWLEGEEREQAIRARVENLMRPELLFVERSLLLDTLDSSWKDHLYAMDQLRDTISFRAYSQQDPRIAYKREGSRMFTNMLETVRDRLGDHIFKARVSPMQQVQQMMAMRQARAQSAASAGPGAARPAPRAAAAGLPMGGGFVGPGVVPSGGLYAPPSKPGGGGAASGPAPGSTGGGSGKPGDESGGPDSRMSGMPGPENPPTA